MYSPTPPPLEEHLQGGEIIYERVRTRGRNQKKQTVPVGIRQLAGNFLIFVVFFALNSLCSSHILFSQINWLMIYVILISISYNIYQSALAAVLASAAYLYSQHLSILELPHH